MVSPVPLEAVGWSKVFGGPSPIMRNFVTEGNGIFFKFFMWTGRFPLLCDTKGIYRFEMKSQPVYFSGAIMALGLLFGMYYVHSMMGILEEVEMTLENWFLIAMLTLFFFFHIGNIIIVLEADKHAKYLNDWHSFHVQLESLTGKSIKSSSFRAWIIFELFGDLVAILFMFFNFGKLNELLIGNGMSYWLFSAILISFPVSTHIIVSYPYIWYLYTSLLKSAANIILVDIQGLSWTSTKSLHQHRLLCVQLRQLCASLGDSFSFSYLVYCTMLFFIALPNLFLGTKAVLEGRYQEVVSTVLTLALISLLAEMSHRAISVVGEGFEEELSDLLAKVPSDDEQQQLLKLMRTVGSNPPRVSLAGYFDLDRGINVPMLSSVVTYLVFILQTGGSAEEEPLPPS